MFREDILSDCLVPLIRYLDGCRQCCEISHGVLSNLPSEFRGKPRRGPALTDLSEKLYQRIDELLIRVVPPIVFGPYKDRIQSVF